MPILFAYYRIAYIAETYALINAICELNIEVLCKYSYHSYLILVCCFFFSQSVLRHLYTDINFQHLMLNLCCADEVLVNTEDMKVLASELRAKINAKISAWAGVKEPSEEQERTVNSFCFCSSLACCFLISHRFIWFVHNSLCSCCSRRSTRMAAAPLTRASSACSCASLTSTTGNFIVFYCCK